MLGNLIGTTYKGFSTPHATESATWDSALQAVNGGFKTQAARYDAAGGGRSPSNDANEVTSFAYQFPLGTVKTTDPAGLETTTFSDLWGGRCR